MGTKQLRFSYQLPLQKRKDSSTKEEHNNIKYIHTYNSISYQRLQLFQEKVKK